MLDEDAPDGGAMKRSHGRIGYLVGGLLMTTLVSACGGPDTSSPAYQDGYKAGAGAQQLIMTAEGGAKAVCDGIMQDQRQWSGADLEASRQGCYDATGVTGH